MSYSIDFLVSSEVAINGRIARKSQYEATGEGFKYVVHVEIHGDMGVADRFVELDADSYEHAHNLANAWVERMNNISASIRKVRDNGTLDKISFIR